MNTIEMTLASFNVFSRSVRVLCRTGRSILTRWHPLFAASSLHFVRYDRLCIGSEPSALTLGKAQRRFILIRNEPLRMLSRPTYIMLAALVVLSGGTIHSATLSEVQSQVFNASCTSCHSGSSPSQGLNLSEGAAYGNTVNVPSTQVSSLDLVEPGDADNSYLMQKLEGTAQTGVQMPNGGPYLNTTLRQLVRDWIEAGAQDDAADTDGDGIEDDTDNCPSLATRINWIRIWME